MSSPRILITGSSGAIGRRVARHFIAHGCAVRGFDRAPSPHFQPDDFVAGDIADPEAVRSAVEGVDTVIHLAAFPDDADFLGNLLAPNVVGLFNICNAARTADVRRLVLASSGQTVTGLWTSREERRSGQRTLRIEEGVAPRNHYALTKVWAETMGEMYAACYGLSVIAARIGWFCRFAEEIEPSRPFPSMYLSHNDACRFFECCVRSETPRAGTFAAMFVTSRIEHPAFDLTEARTVVGFEPQDMWPHGSFDFP